MFIEAIEAILRECATPEAVRAIEQGGAPPAIWDAVEEAGFLELLSPENAGGAGLSLPEIAPVFTLLGRYAVPLPLAQSIAARALLRDTGLAAPPGMTTLAGDCHRDAQGTVCAPNVAFGMICRHVVANLDGALLLLDAASAQRQWCGVHGSAGATLRWPVDVSTVPLGSNGSDVCLFSAALHAAAMAGAMNRVFDMTLQYCNDRSQFGKSIGKFQAVQHQLSVMAEQVAAAGIAAELAFNGGGMAPAPLATAIAKARTSMAVPWVAATAHALHGAIGVTDEYDLQLYTRRLHEWRMADGSEAYWNRLVGRASLDESQAAVSTVVDFARAATQHASV
ncbi:acyl-CoA dehydrogenase family protein [Paraburkholderia sp. BCC1886]|uniref:acyl-CoA dehydrogenase family protein n=1 Tax=Paraburkholderia sp. BCC1886 TaxID=2562670 RepID=UPI0011842575|nr:acyl-CoA dehydrogenase family protein [Paraburkholderia sp. BCC1886]